MGPHSQYVIEIGKTEILVRNCRFICRRVIATIPPGQAPETEDKEPLPPRRSAMSKKPVSRPIEDPLWA